MGNDKDHLGCCGYDEIEKKPQSTSPIYSLKAKTIQMDKKVDGPLVTRRISFMGARTYSVPNRGLR